MENLQKNTSMDDIIFEDRNKGYGAYQLRKDHTRTFLVAMIVSVFFITVLSVSPAIYSYINRLFGNDEIFDNEKEVIVEAIIEDIPLDPETPPPPPLEIPPPKVEMIRFLPPEIKPDIEIKKEEIPPTVEELEEKKNIGNVDQEGDTTIVMISSGPGNAIVDDGEDNQLYMAVEEPAEFPGGKDEFAKFLKKNLVYPRKAEKMEMEGIVYVYFEIDKDGNAINIKIQKGIQEDMDAEALRVIKLMPKWKPGKQNGKAVRTRMIQRVNYKLPD